MYPFSWHVDPYCNLLDVVACILKPVKLFAQQIPAFLCSMTSEAYPHYVVPILVELTTVLGLVASIFTDLTVPECIASLVSFQ